MFNVGGPEIVIILLVALVILGPDQLPKAMRTFGNVSAQVRKVSGGFQDEMRKAMDSIDTDGSSADDKPMSPKPPSGHPDEVVVASAGDLDEIAARTIDPVAPVTPPAVHTSATADRAAG